jgi:hypothetical protein
VKNGLAEKIHRGRRSSVMPLMLQVLINGADSKKLSSQQGPKRSVHHFASRKIARLLRSSVKLQGDAHGHAGRWYLARCLV